MRGLLLALLLATLALGSWPSPASASCLPAGSAQLRARADVIFEGVALQDPTATGVQEFRVTRYLKGSGPTVVRVSTGNVRRADGTGRVTSIAIDVKKGERWRIFGRGSAGKTLRTNACDGSRRL